MLFLYVDICKLYIYSNDLINLSKVCKIEVIKMIMKKLLFTYALKITLLRLVIVVCIFLIFQSKKVIQCNNKNLGKIILEIPS